MIDFSNVTELFVAGKEVKELHINGAKVWEKGGGEFSYAGLTFTATQANSTVAMTAVGSAPSVSLEYTTDGSTWNDFIVGTTTVTLANVGDKMAVRAKTTNSGMAIRWDKYNMFVMTGKIAASNSIMYLLKNNGDLDTIGSSDCFNSLFFGCTSLTQAPELPATTLGTRCYQYMFDGCTSLVNPPSELPALSVTLAGYGDMFAGTSITKSPYIRATSVGTWGMASMFKNCSQLEEIKMDYIGNFSGTGASPQAFTDWVNGVSSTGTFYYNGSDTTRGTSAIPYGWTV